MEDLGVDGRMILKRIFMELEVGACTAFSWLRIDIGDVGL